MLRGGEPQAMLNREGWDGRVLEGELVLEAPHPPQDRAGLGVDLCDLAQAAKRDDEVTVAIEVQGIAVRPVDARAGAVRLGEIRDVEVIERAPLEQQGPGRA